jgi:hypothetical protein
MIVEGIVGALSGEGGGGAILPGDGGHAIIIEGTFSKSAPSADGMSTAPSAALHFMY